MAGSSLLVLIDDIAALLDDVAAMTKVAAKKTAGVLGDDLALNAQQVTGVKADRELPVVWAVAKGSFRNKLILVPAALLISAFIPWLIIPLLMLGGLYLCFEGFEKVAHHYFHDREAVAEERRQRVEKLNDPAQDPLEFEKNKIKGAIRTDFILSAEIIVLTLGIVGQSDFGVRVSVLVCVALGMTAGVYGLVAGIVKLDDAGLHLLESSESSRFAGMKKALGRGLLRFAPWLMKALGVVGTLAMFMVGGGIIAHGVHAIDEGVSAITALLAAIDTVGPVLAAIAPTLLTALVGVLAGAVVVGIVSLFQKIRAA